MPYPGMSTYRCLPDGGARRLAAVDVWLVGIRVEGAPQPLCLQEIVPWSSGADGVADGRCPVEAPELLDASVICVCGC